ncbi:UNVERIFIED_CONTAM: hypothetical protein FKN15_003269 [Acipenser sinensis]
METEALKVVNRGEEDEMDMSGYRLCRWKLAIVGVGVVLTGGFLLLLLYWMPEWCVKATCTRTPIREAEVVLLRSTDEFKRWFSAKVRVMLAPGKNPFDCPDSKIVVNGHTPHPAENQTEDCQRKYSEYQPVQIRYFTLHSTKYYWNDMSQNFEVLKGLEDLGVKCSSVHDDHSKGLTEDEQDYRRLFFGENEIAVKVPSVFKLLIKELSDNLYQRLPDGLFDNQVDLRQLFLDNNRLDDIQLGSMEVACYIYLFIGLQAASCVLGCPDGCKCSNQRVTCAGKAVTRVPSPLPFDTLRLDLIGH